MRQLRIVGVGAALLATAVISIYVTAPSDEIELQDHLGVAQHARVDRQDDHVVGGATSNTDPRVPYQCQSHALHHNQSVAEQGRAYSRHGEPISLLDAFAVHPRCSRLSPNGTGGVGGALPSCSPVPLATFVFNVKVFEFEMQSEEPVKLRGPALRRGQRRQKQV